MTDSVNDARHFTGTPECALDIHAVNGTITLITPSMPSEIADQFQLKKNPLTVLLPPR